MDTASQILFGEFPRSFAASAKGELRQYFVHSESEWDASFKKVRPRKNVYCSTCHFRSDMRPVLDKVFFDFDSAKKDSAFSGNVGDRQKIEQMREDTELLTEVLGNVWSDVQSLVETCSDKDIPTITVFSGLGFHVYLLYQPEVNPVRKKITTSNMFIDECELTTHDRKVVTDVRRILRVPNAQRIDSSSGEAVSCGLWTIPLSEEDVLKKGLKRVFDESTSPKQIEDKEKYSKSERPKMSLYEEYEQKTLEETPTRDLENRDISSEVDSVTEFIVDNAIPMPCVSERIKQSNPDHHVRLNFAVHMLNAGFSVNEIVHVASGLNWIDFDAKKTKRFVKQAKRKRYSEYSCKTMDKRGFCVHSEDQSECDEYGWSSGECLYPKRF